MDSAQYVEKYKDRAGKDVIGRYTARDAADIPAEFASVCDGNGWPVTSTWEKLNGGETGTWFAHESTSSYIYYNAADKMWWIDGPDGLGVYKAPGPSYAPPGAQTAWQHLR